MSGNSNIVTPIVFSFGTFKKCPFVSDNVVFYQFLRDVLREKNGIMWEKFPSGGPPPPTLQFGKPLLSKKKVGFIFHFRTSGTFLVFTKKSPFSVID